MADEDPEQGSEVEDQGGKGMRATLERTIQERNRLSQELTTMKAAEVIRAKGYHLLTADDLKGADPDKVEEIAQGLQQERVDILKRGVEAQFRAQGLEGEQLAAQVADFLTAQPATTASLDEQDAYGRARSVGGSAVGTPVPVVNPDRLSPEAKMEHALRNRPSR